MYTVSNFGVLVKSSGDALTLRPSDIGLNSSGWLIAGKIHEDWFEWVNYFYAFHPIYGFVWGDFEDKVHATSKRAYDNFVKHHPPESWDYWDI